MSHSSADHLHAMRHTAAHVLAAAVLQLYPDAKLGVGPVIENGFYYDILLSQPLQPADLKKIEKAMHKIINRGEAMRREEMNIPDAIKFFQDRRQDFKVELLTALQTKGTTKVNPEEQQDIDPKNKKIASVYWTGDFVDLCRGPHLANTKEVGAFTLDKISGAYWRGDQTNPQLQRVYGLCFATEPELDAYLKMRAEALRRDHKKLGPELDLFTFSDLVGGGLPLWTPKGTLLRTLLDNFVWELRQKYGYQKVEIPHITKKELYETSGHWDKFKDELFRITTREGHEFAMKPMNCPHHTQIYNRRPHSYRELPQRYANTTTCYRDEQTGELSGLSRVRGFTQDDAHVFCRDNQVSEEITKVWEIINTFYGVFGFSLNIRLSLHDPENMTKYLGTHDRWQTAENQLRAVIKTKNAETTEAVGEAAFYGPKIDFLAKDSLGREWQVATIQLDMNMPERFDLTCVNEKGEKERVVMIHAAIMGSIERFLSIIIEHFAGAFPVWLAPVQVMVASVSDEYVPAAQTLVAELAAIDVRVELDDSHESIGKKIRHAEKQKIPFMLVFGAKEAGGADITIREHGKPTQYQLPRPEFLTILKQKISERAL